MSDVYHLAKITKCVSFFWRRAEIYNHGRCWFCSQSNLTWKVSGEKKWLTCQNCRKDISSQNHNQDLPVVTEKAGEDNESASHIALLIAG